MKSNTVISVSKDLIYAQDGQKNYILFSDSKEKSDFFILKDCDAAVFEILAGKQKMRFEDLENSVKQNYSVSGISLEQYLPLFVGMLKEKGFVAVK
jgi:hypothetical protein